MDTEETLLRPTHRDAENRMYSLWRWRCELKKDKINKPAARGKFAHCTDGTIRQTPVIDTREENGG